MKTIALDFDGVLHSYSSGWTGDIPYDPPVEGAQEFIKKLIDKGWDIVIFSTRAQTETGKEGIKQWLSYWKFPLDSCKIRNTKPPADLYVDDRGYRFDGRFDEVIKFINKGGSSIDPWHKKI